MLTQIFMLVVIAYIVAQVVKSGIHNKLLEFFGLVTNSVKEQGGRGTVHSIIDGLFDASGSAKQFAANKAQGLRGAVRGKVAGLTPTDFRFDHEAGELVLFLSKQDDLVIGRDDMGRVYAYEITASGAETELSQKAFERRVTYLQRKGKLSEAQERALKDFLAMGRKSKR